MDGTCENKSGMKNFWTIFSVQTTRDHPSSSMDYGRNVTRGGIFEGGEGVEFNRLFKMKLKLYLVLTCFGFCIGVFYSFWPKY